MAQITFHSRLAFVPVVLYIQQKSLFLTKMLLATGSANTLIKIDAVIPFGVTLPLDARIREMRGIGRIENVIDSCYAE